MAHSADDKNITYYIVTKNWTYADITKYLDIKDVPPNVSVVRDTWASECIEAGRLVDTSKHLIVKQGQTENGKSASRSSPPEAAAEPVKGEPAATTSETVANRASAAASPSAPPEGDGDGDGEDTKQAEPDELTDYLKKADIHGLIEGYISGDEDDAEEMTEKEEHAIQRPLPQEDKENQKWSPNTLLLSKPVGALEHNPNWRTIQIVSTGMLQDWQS